MGRIFWLMAVNSYLLFRLNPTAFSAAVWGSLRRFVSRLTRPFRIGNVGIRRAGRAARGPSSFRNSSAPSAGTSAARSVKKFPQAIMRLRMQRSPSVVRVPFASWRTRWSRARWMAWVATNMYDDRPAVLLRTPRPLREAKRHARLSRMRKANRPADRASS